MITVVGMENAIADVVSIITIVQDREIGVHEGRYTMASNVYIF